MRWFKSNKHPARRIVISPPQARSGRQGISIVACVKNEESYIEEWVRFHRAVGVRHFYIYDDGSTDGTIAKLKLVLDPTECTVIPWIARMLDGDTDRYLNGQVLAFAHAILNFGASYKWMAFIDVDEFLLPRSGSTLLEALAGAKGAPNISLPWHMFGTSGLKSRPNGSLLLNFTARHINPMSPEPHVSNFKCIVDPCEVTEVSVHHFRTRSLGELSANDAGLLATRSGRKKRAFYSTKFLQLNHYYTKSRAEFSAKIQRGWSQDAAKTKYFKKATFIAEVIERETVDDHAMVEFIATNKLEIT